MKSIDHPALRAVAVAELRGNPKPWRDATVLEDLRHHCEELCGKLAPDVGRSPVYMVYGSELPAELRRKGLVGCTARDMDLILQPSIGSRWRGRGFAFYLNEISASVYGKVGNAYPPAHRAAAVGRYFRQAVVGTAIHELGHEACRLAQHDPKLWRPAAVPPANLAKLRKSLTLPIGGDDAPAIDVLSHGWKFARCIVHLVHRARQLPEPVKANVVSEHKNYAMSPIAEYIAALGDEPARFVGADFRDIHRSEPPRDFMNLWRSDLFRYAATLTATDSITSAQEIG